MTIGDRFILFPGVGLAAGQSECYWGFLCIGVEVNHSEIRYFPKMYATLDNYLYINCIDPFTLIQQLIQENACPFLKCKTDGNIAKSPTFVEITLLTLTLLLISKSQKFL